MIAAWEIKNVTGTQKVVLLRLADHADPDTGSCHPSPRHLMEYCGVNKRQLVAHLNGLESLGYVQIHRNPPAKNTYTLTVPTMQNVAGSTVQDSAGSTMQKSAGLLCNIPQGNPAVFGKTTMQGTAGSYKEELVIGEPKEKNYKHGENKKSADAEKKSPESQKKNPDEAAADMLGIVDEWKQSDYGFEIFWKAYPKKTGKINALKKWRGLKPNLALLDEILANMAERLRVGQWDLSRKNFIKDPERYISNRQWEDEVIPAADEKPAAKLQHDDPGAPNYSDLIPWN